MKLNSFAQLKSDAVRNEREMIEKARAKRAAEAVAELEMVLIGQYLRPVRTKAGAAMRRVFADCSCGKRHEVFVRACSHRPVGRVSVKR
jgi:hypothetical protein